MLEGEERSLCEFIEDGSGAKWVMSLNLSTLDLCYMEWSPILQESGEREKKMRVQSDLL